MERVTSYFQFLVLSRLCFYLEVKINIDFIFGQIYMHNFSGTVGFCSTFTCCWV